MSRFAFGLAVVVASVTSGLTLGGQLQAIEFEPEEISNRLTIGYAVSLADVNGDGRSDVIVADADRVVWFENPTWKERAIAIGQTARDNVCLAPLDINGDGRLDLAVGADWRPFDTAGGGTLQWLEQGADGETWTVHPIATEPTLHRIRFADLDGEGPPELLVVPLMGRGTTRPLWAEQPVRVLAFTIPPNASHDPWPVQVLNEQLHVVHNFHPTDFDGDSQTEILVASFEGVSVLRRQGEDWQRTALGSGNQATRPERGASEIRAGLLADGVPYVATIEPWHGFQVVVYTPPAAVPSSATAPGNLLATPWDRTVLDEDLKWGHAVWCADLDGDADQELIVGVRDDGAVNNSESTARRGLRVYDPQPANTLPDGSQRGGARTWQAQRVDPGQVAIEDLAAADLDGDGRTDIVAAGRATRNVRIYWNRTPRVPPGETPTP